MTQKSGVEVDPTGLGQVRPGAGSHHEQQEAEVLKRIFSRKIAVTSAATLGALIVGIAFANWTATGSGSGSAKAVTATVSAVTGDTPNATLYPSATFNGDLFFKVDNTNPYPVRFTDATLGTVTSSNPTGCPASNVAVQNATGLTIDVPADTTTPQSAQLSDVAKMSSSAPTQCQGVTFTIAVDLSGTQQ